MKTIWKFTLETFAKQNKFMPQGAVILHAGVQRGEICIWAEVDDKNTVSEERVIEVFGTGHPIYEDMGVDRKYIGTVMLDEGSLVFHVYERIS